MRDVQTQTLFDAVTPIAVTSSTDATPVVVTATSHGLATGDRVMIFGHTTNVAANGIFLVEKVNANTFQIHNEFTDEDIAGSGAGAGADGVLVKAPPVMLISDFEFVTLQINVTGATVATTIKPIVSEGIKAASATTSPAYDRPNMGGTQTAANPWSYANLVDLDDPSSFFTGSTGLVLAAATHKSYKLNIAGHKYFTVIPHVSWTNGVISIVARAYNNA